MAKFVFSVGPSGVPTVHPRTQEKHATQVVTLRCDLSSAEYGNPPCNQYSWNKVFNERSESVPNIVTKEYTFQMEEDMAGNYTSQCSNQFGASGISEASEVFFLLGPPPAENKSGKLHFIFRFFIL